MSCLFNSLSRFFKTKSAQEIRQDICSYLESNKPIMDGLETKWILDLDEPNYIKKMRRSTTWGGAIEIQAACCLWKLRVRIKDRTTGRWIEFIPLTGIAKHTIEIEWIGQNHYEPIRKY